jgi:hypothetical protein
MERTESKISKIKELKTQGELLTTIENKVLFVVSRYFWHIITTFAILAIIGGILCFLYSLTPVFKSSPVKENYPAAENVSKEEVLTALAPKNKPQSQKQTAQRGALEETASANAEGFERYLAKLAELTELVPDIKKVQQNCLEYSYWYGCSRYALDTTNRVTSALDKLQISDYGSRVQLVDIYIKIASNYEKKNRFNSLNAALNMGTENFSKYLADLTVLHKADSVFKPNINLLKKNANLLEKNPNDGKPLLQYIIQSAPSFSDSVWQDFASYMVDSYKGFKQFQTQKEYTDGFLSMAKEFEASQQISALKKYYDLLGEKNDAREQKIQEIDSKYASDLANAESEYEGKKSGQNAIRVKSAIVIGGAIVTIAFFALVLVILSIQRNVAKLLKAQAKD